MPKKSSASKIKLTDVNSLFGNSKTIKDINNEREEIVEVALADLHEFEGHPFKVIDDEKMEETVESVKKYGVIVPGIVRPRIKGGYEIVAGHRRKRASELAGLETMPVFVRNLSDDESIIVMVDSNLQREEILPSEKAKAYAMKYEALKHQGVSGEGISLNSMSDALTQSKLYGVELDSLTGRIAKKLYPKAKIEIKGFEETQYPNDFFDVAVGNVPFGQYKVSDKEFDKHNFLIHDYFFAKTLDKVRPGGVIAFVTSKGTMDKQNESVRKYLAERAELLGAVRLPNTAFKANAGTEVTSDILIFKKRDRLVKDLPDWVHVKPNEDLWMISLEKVSI